MEERISIQPPKDGADIEGAQRVFKEFLTLYQPTFIRVQYYLEDIIDDAGPIYAEAYRPWYDALHNLFKGTYKVTKNLPLTDIDQFKDAIKTFEFDGSVQFLLNLCENCKLNISREWIIEFREHIHLLLFSLNVIKRNENLALAD